VTFLRAALGFALLALALVGRADAEVCRGSNIPAAELRRHDGAALLLDRTEILQAEAVHLAYGYPDREARLMYHKEFVFRYDASRRVPLWASYRLEGRHVPDRGHDRRNAFRTDPRLLPDETARCKDYDEPVFDRGHLVPNSDLAFQSKRAASHSFYLSNMMPQSAWFNRQLWRYFEQKVRAWARQEGTVHVFSGAVFDIDGDNKPDAFDKTRWMQPTGRVAVPTAFYKIIVRERAGQPDVLAVMLPHRLLGPKDNTALGRLLKRGIVTVAEIEEVTGLTFFVGTPGRADLRHRKAGALWP